jgi:hypothetical protein
VTGVDLVRGFESLPLRWADESERSQDPSRQLGRAAAIDEVEHVVQVDGAVGSESACERLVKPRLLEHVAPPFPEAGIEVHDSLALSPGVVLPR